MPERAGVSRRWPPVGGRTIDVVLRYFLIEDMDEPAAVAPLEPLMASHSG